MDIDNPYQSPASGHHSPLDLPLASLGLRLAGAMLDGLVSILAMVPAMVVMLLSTFCLGWVIPLADGLAIFFGDRRQCLHDHIASTVVVDARYRPGEEIGQIFS